MRKGFVLLFLTEAASVLRAQTPLPSKETFLNLIFNTVVDSTAGHYYLSATAAPCSFVKYDYDEWIKYGLQETVPIYTLNELAKNSYLDRGPCSWQQDSLVKAFCIDQGQIDLRLDPTGQLRSDSTMRKKKKQRLIRRKYAAWARLPAMERTVYYFSRPAFTDDGQYAILDMDYRCDNRQCGQGMTCLFRHTNAGWKLIGRRIRWGQ